MVKIRQHLVRRKHIASKKHNKVPHFLFFGTKQTSSSELAQHDPLALAVNIG